MANTTFNSTQDMIIKIQSLKGKTKLNFYQNINFHYDEMSIIKQNGTFQFEENPFSKDVQGIGKTYQEFFVIEIFTD